MDRGANLEARCHKGWTPLHVATDSGYLGVVSLLLDLGANTTAIDRQRNIPVYHACNKWDLATDRLFFDRSIDQEKDEYEKNECGRTDSFACQL